MRRSFEPGYENWEPGTCLLIYTCTVNAEIVAVGSEMLTPFRQDTNSLFLTNQLNSLGVEVIAKTIVGDDRARLAEAARMALSRADIVIFSGGLGPTEDDLTREAVAEALGVELRRDPALITELYTRFASRRIKMPENNARQAELIEGAEALRNPNGTAPGQWIETLYNGAMRVIILLPGPPWELEPLFVEQCMPRLRSSVPETYIATAQLKLAMVPESLADQRAAVIYKQFPQVQTTILASAGEVQFHLRAQASTQEEAEYRVETLSGLLEEEFAKECFSTGDETLEQIVGYYLQMRNTTVSVAESCTGGLLAERLTRVSGSSRYFMGGVVVYSNEMKTLFCDVPPLMIGAHGAVSKEVAIALAEGIRGECRTTYGIGITGVAGPTGGTEEKPVGLVYIALADGGKPEVIERRFPGDRLRIRHFATQQALEMLRKKLV